MGTSFGESRCVIGRCQKVEPTREFVDDVYDASRTHIKLRDLTVRCSEYCVAIQN